MPFFKMAALDGSPGHGVVRAVTRRRPEVSVGSYKDLCGSCRLSCRALQGSYRGRLGLARSPSSPSPVIVNRRTMSAIIIARPALLRALVIDAVVFLRSLTAHFLYGHSLYGHFLRLASVLSDAVVVLS